MLHEIFHIVLLVLFLSALGAGFLGLIGPLVQGEEAGLKVPGRKATALFFLSALVAGAGDWILHRYVF